MSRFTIVYNAAGTVYLADNGELEVLRPGARAPLLFDSEAAAGDYVTLTQDGGRPQRVLDL